jgi:hypothetical protein
MFVPGGALFAHGVDLRLDRFVGHGPRLTRDTETLRARQVDLWLHFEMKLERERLPLRELDVMHVGLGGQFHLGIANHLLVGFLNEALDRFLPDCIAESLADHGWWRLSRTKTGQSRRRGVASNRLFLC